MTPTLRPARSLSRRHWCRRRSPNPLEQDLAQLGELDNAPVALDSPEGKPADRAAATGLDGGGD